MPLARRRPGRAKYAFASTANTLVPGISGSERAAPSEAERPYPHGDTIRMSGRAGDYIVPPHFPGITTRLPKRIKTENGTSGDPEIPFPVVNPPTRAALGRPGLQFLRFFEVLLDLLAGFGEMISHVVTRSLRQ